MQCSRAGRQARPRLNATLEVEEEIEEEQIEQHYRLFGSLRKMQADRSNAVCSLSEIYWQKSVLMPMKKHRRTAFHNVPCLPSQIGHAISQLLATVKPFRNSKDNRIGTAYVPVEVKRNSEPLTRRCSRQSRLQEGYRSMGRGRGKFHGARKRACG